MPLLSFPAVAHIRKDIQSCCRCPEIVGRPLSDFMLETNENNIQGVSGFVDQNFLVKDAVTHEQKRDGTIGIFLNNTTPRFRN